VFARLRKTCEWLARALCDAGVDAAAYHAGQDAAQRLRTQRAWSQGDTSVVVRPGSLLRRACAACHDALRQEAEALRPQCVINM